MSDIDARTDERIKERLQYLRSNLRYIIDELDEIRGSHKLPVFRRVVVESPFQGEPARHIRYLQDAMADCFSKGEAPFASHGLYTQAGVLDDNDPAERERGIIAGFAWAFFADATVVYTDLGISPGMRRGIHDAQAHGRAIEFRRLEGWAHARVSIPREG